jgi:hypothetical protein
MRGSPDDRRRNDRWLRQRAVALGVLAGFLLVFTWPFVRSPPLTLGASYVHLLAAWAVAIVALVAMSRSFGGRPPGGEDGDA